MHYAEIKIVIQKPSNEAVEQDEDTEDDSTIVALFPTQSQMSQKLIWRMSPVIIITQIVPILRFIVLLKHLGRRFRISNCSDSLV